MNGLRTYLAALLLAFGSALHAANTASPSEEALTLAACQARYTAVLEHAWLMHGDTEAAAMRRDLFAAMLAAALHDAPDQNQIKRQLISFRIAQKHAASGLLDTARFGTDPRRSRIALGVISQQLSACDRLVIGRIPPGA
ncbi:hypothetical protein [Mameliella alba]|uniref:hypothetical protein n=1 Tax=Mameliella alba TaxID=561184 RepID=UPI001430ECF8|nr:hypothetical protein [Mameliella alba]